MQISLSRKSSSKTIERHRKLYHFNLTYHSQIMFFTRLPDDSSVL